MCSSLRTRSLLTPFALFLAVVSAASANAQAQPAGPPVATPGPPSAFGDSSTDKPDSVMAAKMLRERNEARQKQIVDETNQLLDLAKQLKDAVDKTSKDQLSLDVLRKAEEIEKLAREVKAKMRDGTSEPTS